MPLPSSLALPNPHWMPETRSPSTLGLLSPPKSLPTFKRGTSSVRSPRAINIVLLKIATSATPFYTRHQSLLSSANRNILGMWLVAMHTTQREPIHIKVQQTTRLKCLSLAQTNDPSPLLSLSPSSLRGYIQGEREVRASFGIGLLIA